MANRKSIKDYEILSDITGQEEEIVLIGYDNTNNGTTRGVLASALGGVYDKVIRTQTEFDDLIASPTWLGAQSVALVGEFTANAEIVIPATVKQIHGFNGAKITIYQGRFGYDTRPDADNGYEIRNLAMASEYAPTFFNCTNLINCTGESDVEAFYYCTNLTNCTGESNDSNAFYYCTNLTNCTGKSNDSNAFYYCTNLTNCTGKSNDSNAFYHCTNLINCIGESNVYTFFNIDIASNCMGSWGGANFNIDSDTCPDFT